MKRIAACLFFLVFAAISTPSTASARTFRDSIGANIHFTDPLPGEMDMLAASGLGWVRMDLAWGATETTKGVYDFSHYDTLLHDLDSHHLRALLIFDYGNNIYGAGGRPPYDDAGRTAFANWAVAAVDHFKGRHVLWELWNEPNGDWFWPHHSAGDYAKLALTVDKAIHDRFPHETLIGPATSGIDLDFLETCFKAGCLDYWDAVSVHPYRQTAPETAAPDYTKLRDLIARYAPPGKSIPIISGEWGYSVSWGGYSDDLQAKYAVRELLFNVSRGIPLSIWYDWHDDGVDPKNAEHNFGLTSNPLHAGQTPVYDPKPAYTAVQTMTSTLGDYTFDTRVAAGDPSTDFVLAFKSGRHRRWVAWTPSPTPHSIVLPLRPGQYTIVDWQGHSSTVTADKSGLSITVSDAPEYVAQ